MQNWQKFKGKSVEVALKAYNADFKRVGETGTFHDWLAQEEGYAAFDAGATFAEDEGEGSDTGAEGKRYEVVRNVYDEGGTSEVIGEFADEIEAWMFAERKADEAAMKGTMQLVSFCKRVSYTSASGVETEICVRVKG